MKVYADTSFLISLYSPDANSVAAAGVMQSSKGECYITELSELEMMNALQLRVFRAELTAAQTAAAWADFETDTRHGIFRLRPLSDAIFERARQLCRRTTARLGIRTSDLLHVASALDLGVEWLYSFDQRQRKLAHAVHLKLN